MARVSALITCGGKSVRFGSNKLLADICGSTVIERTVRCFLSAQIEDIIVIVSAENEAKYRQILLERCEFPIRIVHGSDERFKSAYNGLRVAAEDLVLIHDGVRPFVAPSMIEDVVSAGARYGAAMLGLPSVVQVKFVSSDGYVKDSPDRSLTWLGQTPQVFRRDLLEQAYALAIAEDYDRVSDDADLVAHYTGHPVKIIRGAETNIKITTPTDLYVAQQIAASFDSPDENPRIA